MMEIANQMHTVTEEGKRRRRSTLVLMLLALRNLGADSNVRSFRAYRKYLAKFEPQETHLKVEGGVLVAPAGMTPAEAIAEGEKANEEARARRAAQSQE